MMKKYRCAACGDEIDWSSPTIRKYAPRDCKHPILKSFHGIICSNCWNWSYNIFVRLRRNQKPLKLKDGRYLLPNGEWFRYDNSAFFNTSSSSSSDNEEEEEEEEQVSY